MKHKLSNDEMRNALWLLRSYPGYVDNRILHSVDRQNGPDWTLGYSASEGGGVWWTHSSYDYTPDDWEPIELCDEDIILLGFTPPPTPQKDLVLLYQLL